MKFKQCSEKHMWFFTGVSMTEKKQKRENKRMTKGLDANYLHLSCCPVVCFVTSLLVLDSCTKDGKYVRKAR